MRSVALAVLVACGHHGAPARSTTTLAITITDAGKPVGARVLLFDADHQPVRFGTLDLYGKRQATTAVPFGPDVLGTWDGIIVAAGEAKLPIGTTIPYGRYHVWAWRGVEYERWEGDIDLSPDRGDVALPIALDRAWTPHGTLAADLHVHAHASNDSGLPNPQRVIAQVAAGIQVIGLSDHNVNGTIADDIHALGLDGVVAAIPSNELTAEQLHVGVYPVQVDRDKPEGGAPPVPPGATPKQVFDIAHAFPGHPVVQLNHPRFRFAALYDGAKWDGVSWPPPFPIDYDAVEVLAGYSAFNVPGDRRFDDGVRDFYTFVDHGHLIAPLGNSDTHDLNWVLDGTARNYVFVDDPRTQPFDEAAFVGAIRARRVVATTGPWLDVEAASAKDATPTVGPGQAIVAADGAIWLDVTVAMARWVKVDRIRVTIGAPGGGQKVVQTIDVPAGQRTFRWAGRIEVGASDTWVGITADGDTALPLELTGSYQRDKWNHPGVTPFAIASPILVDADGDGRWKRGDADISLR
ncbi:MAG TPA: CehA/McbA family metallohydrolase [Kofleriaceae bacterium]|jgi:hypothetical protein